MSHRVLLVLLVLLSACGPQVGAIRVLGPTGATVYLDEHPQGEIGEGGLLLEDVPVGARRLRVEQAGRIGQGVSLVIARWQTVELGLGPLASLPSAAPAPPTDRAHLASQMARTFYRQGQAARALAVLGEEDAVLRVRIEQVRDLHARASAMMAEGDAEGARPLWNRLLVVEPDPSNWYHAEAQRRRDEG